VREVKQRPKFHCDFCSRTGTKTAMEDHERICWKNPNRVCAMCNNRGTIPNYWGGEEPCYYCSQFDPEIAGVPTRRGYEEPQEAS